MPPQGRPLLRPRVPTMVETPNQPPILEEANLIPPLMQVPAKSIQVLSGIVQQILDTLNNHPRSFAHHEARVTQIEQEIAAAQKHTTLDLRLHRLSSPLSRTVALRWNRSPPWRHLHPRQIPRRVRGSRLPPQTPHFSLDTTYWPGELSDQGSSWASSSPRRSPRPRSRSPRERSPPTSEPPS